MGYRHKMKRSGRTRRARRAVAPFGARGEGQGGRATPPPAVCFKKRPGDDATRRRSCATSESSRLSFWSITDLTD